MFHLIILVVRINNPVNEELNSSKYMNISTINITNTSLALFDLMSFTSPTMIKENILLAKSEFTAVLKFYDCHQVE